MPPPDRERVFHEFHKRVGLKPFAPEFIDSLVAVMRDPKACLSERVFAWAKWRAWGNSSEYAVSDWDPGLARSLDQLDCAVDLAWFEEGKRILWVEGAPEGFRKKARGGPETPRLIKDKSKISKAFSKNECRGTVHLEGHRVKPVANLPAVVEKRLTAHATFEGNQAFFKWWKVDDPGNSQAFEVAQSAYYAARKIARIAYRRYKDQATPEVGILIDVKASPNTSNTPPAVGRSASAPGEPQATDSIDRPNGNPANNPFKAGTGEWLETHIRLPVPLDDAILNQIAATIHTNVHLEQFQKAALRQRNPRGWKVFVKIAQECAKHQAKYEKSMAAGVGEQEDPLVKRMKEDMEKRKAWPTS